MKLSSFPPFALPPARRRTGTLRGTRPDELAATAIGEALRRAPGIEPAGDRRRDSGMRDAGGRARDERRAHRESARGHSCPGLGGDGQPLLLVRASGDCLRARSGSCAASPRPSSAGGTESMSLVPMGGHKIAPESDADRHISRRVPEHRPGRREPRARVRHLAGGTGRLRAPQPSARDCRDRRGPLRRGDRSGHGAV